MTFDSLFLLALLGTGTASVPTVRLANGVGMPQLLLGTPSCGAPSPRQSCVDGTRDAVAEALRRGFPGADSAHHYGNQPGIAAGIAQAGAQHAWVTSKIEACNNSFVRLGHCADDTRARFMDNLRQLNRTSVDLMLLHAPTATGGGSSVYPGPEFGCPSCNCSEPRACAAMQQQWAVMEGMYKQGKARSIGVSNYCVACLDCLAKTSTIQPHVNQVRLHAGMDAFRGQRDPVVRACQARNIALQAYSPLGSGSSAVLKGNLTSAIGQAHGVSAAQVALRWLVSHGVAVVTRTTSQQVEYMRQDLAIWNWTLTSGEMARLDAATFANESAVKTMCLA
eukprot:g6213.t1